MSKLNQNKAIKGKNRAQRENNEMEKKQEKQQKKINRTLVLEIGQ